MKKQMAIALTVAYTILQYTPAHAQKLPELETGGQKMPAEWIDKDTHHHVVRLTDINRSNLSFYFHNNPFIGNKMVYYSSAATGQMATDRVKKVETYNGNAKDRQIYVVDLATRKCEPVTHQPLPMTGEILGKKGNVYYQIKDSVFCTNVASKQTRLVYVFPADFKAGITTVNADETLLAGAWATDKEKEILKENPNKSDYFRKIYEAHQLRTLFTINTKTGKLTKLFSDTAWLNHVQFSSTDPNLLMFCHEGPWHLVDRIWTIDINSKKVQLIHKRTVNGEIAGHEWFSPDGKTIYYDLQQPRSVNFFVGGTDVKTLAEKKYSLTRNEWSVHFNISPDQKLFCGDGGDPGQVAHAPDGEYIYLFHPEGDKFVSEKLVNMKHHNYHLEPNVHFSPDGKWIIFRANFEGIEQSYAVEIKKSS